MNESIYEFINPEMVELDEDGDWAIRQEDKDTLWLSSSQYDVRVILTKKFDPQKGDYVMVKQSGLRYVVVARDKDRVWLRYLNNASTYVTMHVNEVVSA